MLQVQHVERHRRRDVGVAVAVAAGPGAEAQRPRRLGQLDAHARGLAVELVEQVGHDLRRDRAQVVHGRPRLVLRLGLHHAQLVGLPQQVDELGQATLDRGRLRRRSPGVLELERHLGDLAQQPQHGPPARLGGVRREHRSVLDLAEHRAQQLRVDAAVGEGLLDAAERRRERSLGVDGELLPAVQLLGDVDQLEVEGERPREHDGALGLELVEGGAQLRGARAAVGSPGEVAHALDQLEQLGALVAGERLAEQRRELAHRRPQRRVLLVGGDAAGEERRVGLAPVGLQDPLDLLGGAIAGAHGSILPLARVGRVTSPRPPHRR